MKSLRQDQTLVEQQRYQIRFDWGFDGAVAIGTDADVLVWVDAIATESMVLDLERVPARPGVIATSVATAAAVAAWILRLQERLGRRVVVAVVAAGELRESRRPRYAVEDLLNAGAVIHHLGRLGIDATSPEAAVCEAAYRDLEQAVGHLLTASVTSASSTGTVDARGVDNDLGPDAVVVHRDHPDC